MNNKAIAEKNFAALTEAYKQGLVEFKKTSLFDDLFLHLDVPAPGNFRFTYAMFDSNNNIVADAVFVRAVDKPVIDCGWCVDSESRGQGIGGKIVEKSLQELIHGLSNAGLKSIYLGASVDSGNEASIKIARKHIGDEEILDGDNGIKCYTYQRFIDFSK